MMSTSMDWCWCYATTMITEHGLLDLYAGSRCVDRHFCGKRHVLYRIPSHRRTVVQCVLNALKTGSLTNGLHIILIWIYNTEVYMKYNPSILLVWWRWYLIVLVGVVNCMQVFVTISTSTVCLLLRTRFQKQIDPAIALRRRYSRISNFKLYFDNKKKIVLFFQAMSNLIFHLLIMTMIATTCNIIVDWWKQYLNSMCNAHSWKLDFRISRTSVLGLFFSFFIFCTSVCSFIAFFF